MVFTNQFSLENVSFQWVVIFLCMCEGFCSQLYSKVCLWYSWVFPLIPMNHIPSSSNFVLLHWLYQSCAKFLQLGAWTLTVKGSHCHCKSIVTRLKKITYSLWFFKNTFSPEKVWWFNLWQSFENDWCCMVYY